MQKPTSSPRPGYLNRDVHRVSQPGITYTHYGVKNGKVILQLLTASISQLTIILNKLGHLV